MWEYFRHTRLHNKLRKFRRLQSAVRSIKDQTSRYMRQRRLRKGGGLREIRSLESQRDLIAGLIDYQILVPDELINLTPRRLELLRQQIVVPLVGDQVRTKKVVRLILQDVKIDMSTGVIVTPDNRLFADSNEHVGLLQQNPTYGEAVPARPRYFAGLCTIIHEGSYSNYFHWLIDYLPRLYPMQEMGEPITLLVPDTLPAKHLHMLKLCIPSNFKLEVLSLYLHRWVHVEKLVYVPRMTHWHFPMMPMKYFNQHRRVLLDALNIPPQPERERNIYITRREARRRLLNEAEVQQMLLRYDFTPYELSSMTFDDQVRLFRGAKRVFAVHGAGLVNIMFSDHIDLLELTSINAAPTYALLSQVCEHEYDFLMPRERYKFFDLSLRYLSGDNALNNLPISVDLEQLDADLQRMIANS